MPALNDCNKDQHYKESHTGPDRVVHVVRASSQYTKVAGSIPGQGT